MTQLKRVIDGEIWHYESKGHYTNGAEVISRSEHNNSWARWDGKDYQNARFYQTLRDAVRQQPTRKGKTMKTKITETVKLRKLWAKHVELVIAGDNAKNPDCRREYYDLANEAYRKYETAGGKK